MREGHEQIGYGCAGVAYRAGMQKTTVRATMGKDGVATFRASASDVGQGVVHVPAHGRVLRPQQRDLAQRRG